MTNKLATQASQINLMQLVRLTTVLEDIKRNEAPDVSHFLIDIETIDYYANVNQYDINDIHQALIYVVANDQINGLTRAKARRKHIDTFNTTLINPQYDLGYVQNQQFTNKWTNHAIDKLINDIKEQTTYWHVPNVTQMA